MIESPTVLRVLLIALVIALFGCAQVADEYVPPPVDLKDAARDFTRLKAAWALSRITSPSCPVRINAPLPGMRVASSARRTPTSTPRR